jgi:hypothetical protein
MYFDTFQVLVATELDRLTCVLKIVGILDIHYPTVVICEKAADYIFNYHFQKSPPLKPLF